MTATRLWELIKLRWKSVEQIPHGFGSEPGRKGIHSPQKWLTLCASLTVLDAPPGAFFIWGEDEKENYDT